MEMVCLYFRIEERFILHRNAGMTWDPAMRYEQHLSGFGGKYTAKYGVNKLVYLEEHKDFGLARQREVQIKDFSRKKKRKLIDEYQKLS